MNRLLVVALVVLLCGIVATPAHAGATHEGNISLDSLRLGLLELIVEETEGASRSGGASVVLLDGDRVDEAFDYLVGDFAREERIRVFQGSRLLSEGTAPSIERQSAILNLWTGSVFTVGSSGNRTVIEDLRPLIHRGTLYVLRDIYLDGEAADLSVGRSLPVLLEQLSPDGVRLAGAAATAAPKISSLSGVTSDAAGISNGRAAMSCGKTWNDHMVINNEQGMYPWTINGSNFGTSKGTLAIGSLKPAAKSWTSTQIVTDPTLSKDSSPVCTTLTVTASTGSATYGVNIAPAIKSRIYGQCSWYVALKRLNLGLQPSPSAYGGYSSITADWVPKVGDQLHWASKHTAIITGVKGPTSQAGGYTSYTVTIEEYNADCRNSFNRYTSEFQIQTVSGKKSITKYPKSSVTSLGETKVYYR
ncbi:MAG TPA: hypothetical protein VJ725_14250 [Thermoanaerobaculia bacterium]|nr:hypothetical protein [Thermoanaerobaculia bacterium]